MLAHCSLAGEENISRIIDPSLGDNGLLGPGIKAGTSYLDDDLESALDNTSLAHRPSFGVIGDKRPLESNRKDSFDLDDGEDYCTPMRGDYRFDTFGYRRENKNFIDLSRVKRGLDVRTTVGAGSFLVQA